VLLLAFTGTTAGAAQHAPRTERVERVSTVADGGQADGPSSGASISADGRQVAFASTAPSLGCERWMGRPQISPTGQWITYAATLPATDADPDPQPRVYRFEFDGGTTDVVSAPSAGPAGNPSIDHDGRYIAFEQGGDVHVRDLDTGTTTARARGAQPSISGHGTEFAYASGRSVYLLEIATGKRQLVRWTAGAAATTFRRSIPPSTPTARSSRSSRRHPIWWKGTRTG
jgi:hypothetical protein